MAMRICKSLLGNGLGLLLIGTMLLAGCSLLPNHKDDFGKLNDDFMLRWRWHDVVGAAQYFEPDLRPAFLERYEAWDDLKVTAFEAVRHEQQLEGEREIRTTHYRIEYHVLPRLTVKQLRFSLRWEQPAEGGGWMIAEAFPVLD